MMIKWALIFIAVFFIGLAILIRVAPISYGLVHKDPEDRGFAGGAGSFFVHPTVGDMPSPAYTISPEMLAQKINEALISMGGRRIDFNNKGYATYEFRSRVFGFPDFLTFKIVTDDAQNSRPIIFSTLYYGKSDLGVNKKRVEELLEKLD